MHNINPFGQNPAQITTDRILGKSYHVVKTVYLNLDLLKSIHESTDIKYIVEHFDEIKNIGASLDALTRLEQYLDDLLALPDLKTQIEKAAEDYLKQFDETQEFVKDNIKDFAIRLYKELELQIQNAAAVAMFSFRTSSEELRSYEILNRDILSPQDNIKVGDTVLDPLGYIYKITQLTETTFTVNAPLFSVRGPIGLPGIGLVILGSKNNYEQLIQENPIGKPGDAWIMSDTKDVYLWSDSINTWFNAGNLQGIKGDTGQSANEILMNPDPEKYFLEIYGQTHGDIIGTLVVEQVIEPSPVESFNSALDAFAKALKGK